MTDTRRSNSNGGTGFLGLLTILFIGLKLTGYIAWSWWWVLAPIWVPFAIGMGALLSIVAWMLVRNAKRKARAA